MDLFAGGYETEVRAALESACRDHDLNLMLVYGRAIDHPDAWVSAHNSVYQLIRADRVDAVVALGAALAAFIGPEGLRDFLCRYRPMALCSWGIEVPGVPSIAVDNRVGMDATMRHLLGEHGYRRVAFIAGPAENTDARARFEAYREALAQHGVPLEPALIANGDFVRRSGYVAMETILDRAPRPEVVVAANDAMALGAIAALRARGVRVPRDVAVTGFDDLAMARLADPPLTSVGQPLAAMSELAIRLVVEQLEGRAVPLTTLLPAHFIARQSCGCDLRKARNKAYAGPALAAPSPAALLAEVQRLRSACAAREPVNEGERDVATLLAALESELREPGDVWLETIARKLREVEGENERYQELQLAITRIRDALRPLATLELEDLFSEARSEIALANTRQQVQQRLEHDQIYHRLLEHGERISTALDLPSLVAALSRELPTLGIVSANFSRYVDASARELEPLLCLPSGVCEPRSLGPLDLVPRRGAQADERRSSVVFPLAYESQKLGVAVFDYASRRKGYQMVRDQVSAALRGVALHQEILEKKTLHERRIQEQERTATAKRIQSLSVLAGGVAHDLNNVLGPLVALPEVILEELDAFARAHGAPAPELRADIETIQAAALRATQTIKDLLTLGRQGHAAKETLELNQAIASWLISEPLHGVRGFGRKPNVRVQLHGEPLFVHGSPSHLTRAVSNLLHNAVEAITDDGQVTLQTRRLRVEQPTLGYELIEPGEYALIVVSDTGAGIAHADIGRVFEPFFSSKKLGEQSGSGLGLAIVHGVVKEHAGFVNVESSATRGTTFTLYIPLAAAAPAPAQVSPEAPRGRARILVVDDEPVQLRTARRVLAHLGYDVDVLASGRAARELFVRAYAKGAGVRSPYDLVILDMMLNEDEDGLFVLDEIERCFPTQRAIIASGHASSDRAELAVRRGLVWLMKPYTTDALGRAVQSALERRSAPAPAPARSSSWPSP